MSEAPSEKHLEEYIIDNFAEFGDKSGVYFDFIANQVKLPSGKCDLIGIGCNPGYTPLYSVCIAELKKGHVDETAFMQLLRYMSDVKSIWEYCLDGIPYIANPSFEYAELCTFEGVLIGKSVSDSVIAACGAVNVNVVLYDFDPTAHPFFKAPYKFDMCEKEHTTLQQRISGATGVIKSVVRDVYYRNLKQHVPDDEFNYPSPIYRQHIQRVLEALERGEL